MRRGIALSILVTMTAVVGVVSAPQAGAYGSAALWQIGISANCNNPTVCGADQLGGF
jgi:hypothetical protein